MNVFCFLDNCTWIVCRKLWLSSLTTSFAIPNFGNTWLSMFFFFFKIFKSWAKLQKSSKKFLRFLGNSIWDGCGKFLPFWRIIDAYILHIGANDLTTDKKLDDVCSEISQLVKVLKTNKNKIVISTIVQRGDACNTKIENVNSLL